MLLESPSLLITLCYCLLISVLPWLLLTPITQTSGPRPFGPEPRVLSLPPYPMAALVSLLHTLLRHDSSFLSFLMVPSLGNLNPAYVSSPQLLAAGIFIYQSELTGGQGPSVCLACVCICVCVCVCVCARALTLTDSCKQFWGIQISIRI